MEFLFGSYLIFKPQENLRAIMSITLLFVGVLGLFTENTEFRFHWRWGLLSRGHQTALCMTVPPLDCISVQLKQEGHPGKRAMYILQWLERNWSHSQNIARAFQKPISPISVGPGHNSQTHSISKWSVQIPVQLNVPSHQRHAKWKKFTNIVFSWNLELLRLKLDKYGQ